MKRKHIDDTTKREQLQRLTIEYEELGKKISILKDEVKNQEMNDLYDQGHILVFSKHDEDKFANKMFLNLLSRQRHYSALNIYLENLQSTIRDADINSYTQ
jgi:hypothetical protein